MARFLVKASEFKNVCKAVNDRKLAELKKEIIEILKKQDEKEVKKAIDYFESHNIVESLLEQQQTKINEGISIAQQECNGYTDLKVLSSSCFRLGPIPTMASSSE